LARAGVKNIIIKEWLRDSTQSLVEIAYRTDTHFTYVSEVLSCYAESLEQHRPLWLVPSFIYSGDYILFDGINEKRVIVWEKKIINPEEFTNYELTWLKSNLKIGIWIEK